MDFRRQSKEHIPITIDRTPVERVNSFKFLCVHITQDLTWSAHTHAMLKKVHQCLFFLRLLRKFGMNPSLFRSFYICTVECPDWLHYCLVLEMPGGFSRHILGCDHPSLQNIYTRRCMRKAQRIISDSSHPSHRLLALLPSGIHRRSIQSHTSRLRDSFFPQDIRLLTCQN